MNFEKEPTLFEFNKVFTDYVNDCMDTKGNVSSHTFPANLTVYDTDDNSYTIVAIKQDYLGGCGCPAGIEIVIKKD